MEPLVRCGSHMTTIRRFREADTALTGGNGQRDGTRGSAWHDRLHERDQMRRSAVR
jgi:hypothetical protein